MNSHQYELPIPVIQQSEMKTHLFGDFIIEIPEVENKDKSVNTPEEKSVSIPFSRYCSLISNEVLMDVLISNGLKSWEGYEPSVLESQKVK